MISDDILEAFADPLILFSDNQTGIRLAIIDSWDIKNDVYKYTTTSAAKKWLEKDAMQRNLAGVNSDGEIVWLASKASGVNEKHLKLFFTRIAGIECDWVKWHLHREDARSRVINDGLYNAFGETWDGHIFQINTLAGDLRWIAWHKS